MKVKREGRKKIKKKKQERRKANWQRGEFTSVQSWSRSKKTAQDRKCLEWLEACFSADEARNN